MNNKFSIGVVIAIVLQVSAFVWWTAQQAQTIMQLETEMAELTAKTEQEKQFNLQRDVSELKLQLIELNYYLVLNTPMCTLILVHKPIQLYFMLFYNQMTLSLDLTWLTVVI